MDMSLDFSEKEWMKYPPARWNAGLERAGLNFMGELKDYPPKAAGTDYERTGTMRKKARFTITEEGREMEFGSVGYTKFALFGTGIYGPEHKPITPKNAKMLSWVGASGTRYFARSVKGYIWAGKADAIKQKMIDGFIAGVRNYDNLSMIKELL